MRLKLYLQNWVQQKFLWSCAAIEWFISSTRNNVQLSFYIRLS